MKTFPLPKSIDIQQLLNNYVNFCNKFFKNPKVFKKNADYMIVRQLKGVKTMEKEKTFTRNILAKKLLDDINALDNMAYKNPSMAILNLQDNNFSSFNDTDISLKEIAMNYLLEQNYQEVIDFLDKDNQ